MYNGQLIIKAFIAVNCNKVCYAMQDKEGANVKAK